MKRIKTALISAGKIGQMHGKNLLHSVHNAQLLMVMDKYNRKEWLNDITQETIPVTNDIEEVFHSKEIEAVVIAASSKAHTELIEMAAKAKKHVFCEKPVAFSVEEILHCGKLCEEAGVKFQVAFNRRFDPDTRKLTEAARLGRAGKKLYMIKIKNRDPELPRLSFVEKSGGIFFDFNSHDFDTIHAVSQDDIQEIFAIGGCLIDENLKKYNDIDSNIISMRLKNGTLAAIDCCRETGYGYDQQLEVFGSAGSLLMQNLRENTILTSAHSGINIAKPLSNYQTRYAQSYILELIDFFDLSKKPETGAFEAARSIAVCHAAKKSFETNSPQKVAYPAAI